MQHNKLTQKMWIGSLLAALVWAMAIGCAAHTPPAATSPEGSYQVVGIGPGDGDLMTVRAMEAIRAADVVFCSSKTREKLSPYVDFSGKQVLDGYSVLFRYYGRDCSEVNEKKQSRHRMSCEQYHRKQTEFAGLVRRAVSAGKHVVLLSSGDPTIYGPDIWSLTELQDLNPTIVPGLSAFNAANAALKAGLGEVILTAPFKKERSRDTIEQLAGHERATMVIFMPRDMKDLFARLSGACPAETPVAIVGNAGMQGRETITLGTVGKFNTDLSGIESRLSIVYVGRPLNHAQCKAAPPAKAAGRGKYYLVGMGPGDPDLATVRALKVIESADLIFAHQRLKDKFQRYLTGKKVLTGYHRLFPFYGKACAEVSKTDKKRERMSCEQYHQKQSEFAALVRTAVAEGKTVAMLDSGDPLVYGPCAWSLIELRDLDTEVVPGLSCFNAANAALKAGVTEGKASHSVILASGWSVDEMAVHQSTIVLFTMRTQFKKFIDSLSAHYPSDTPVAIVFSAGYVEKERVMRGTLGTILDQVGEDRLPFEYLLYVGDFLDKGEM
jgi:precorrin-4 methylase